MRQRLRTRSRETPIPRKRPRRRNDDASGANGRRGGPERPRSTAPARERAYLVGIDTGRGEMSARESMGELARLARTAGALVVGQTLQRRPKPDPAHYIGSGKVEEVRAARQSTDYSVVILDDQLSPAQQLKLEKAFDVKVLDRSALILDIFASRARTREASIQVELAQHEYLLPRLRGQWQHLERMEGAMGARGPGETQLETDRRLISVRIAKLKKQIEQLRKQRALQRRRRDQQGVPVVSLVGYANAGKSSIMRALAGADVLAADAPFATLDTTTRRVGPYGAGFVLTDTVGFMQKLPAQLISAFRATLEELQSADLLLHVVDTTSSAVGAQIATVIATLDDLGLGSVPMLTVLNQADGLLLDDGAALDTEADLSRLDSARFVGPDEEALFTSATEGWGIDALRERLLYEFFGVEATAAAATI